MIPMNHREQEPSRDASSAEEVYAEYRQRIEAGEPASLDEYCERYPRWAHALHLLDDATDVTGLAELAVVSEFVEGLLNQDLPDASLERRRRPKGPTARSADQEGEESRPGSQTERLGASRELADWAKRHRAACGALVALGILAALVPCLVAWRQATRARSLESQVESLLQRPAFVPEKADPEVDVDLEAEALTDLAHLFTLMERAETSSLETLEDVASLEAWLAEGRELHGRLPMYRRSYDELRARGKAMEIRTPEDFPAYHPLRVRFVDLERERSRLVEARDALDRSGANRLVELYRATLERREVRCLKRQQRIEAAIRRFGYVVLADRKEQGLHDALARLVCELEAFGSLEPEPGWLARLEQCRDDLETSTVASATAWSAALQSIADPARSPRYGGYRLRVQRGLVPIGADPETGLWEFAHLPSGAVPTRGGAGRVRLSDDSGIVFVLVPIGDERPLLVGKYELTQGQWLHMTDRDPSFLGPGAVVAGQELGLTHPVEGVSALEAAGTLQRFGLRLPTVDEWRSVAAGARELDGGQESSQDGDPCHTPVGTFRANGFGLHDIDGNVAEWCEGSLDSASHNGLEQTHPVLGGSFRDIPRADPIDRPRVLASGTRASWIGLRAVREVRP